MAASCSTVSTSSARTDARWPCVATSWERAASSWSSVRAACVAAEGGGEARQSTGFRVSMSITCHPPSAVCVIGSEGSTQGTVHVLSSRRNPAQSCFESSPDAASMASRRVSSRRFSSERRWHAISSAASARSPWAVIRTHCVGKYRIGKYPVRKPGRPESRGVKMLC